MNGFQSTINDLIADKRTSAILSALPEGAELYLVGGTVRDALIGREIKDLDYTTNLEPQELIEIFEKNSIPIYPTGLQHQTVTAKPVQDLEHIEITTFRSSGMNPEGGVVKGQSIEEDLSYRDFTINSLAICCHTATLIDPNQGNADIRNKTLKAVKSASERFTEDPLRILRMVRIAAQLGFEIDIETKKASSLHIQSLSSVSIERIREEFSKILCSPKASWAVNELESIGALKTFLPEVSRYVDFEQNKFHKADLFNHSLEVLDKVSPELTIRLAALFHDVGKPDTLSTDENGDRHFYKHESVGAGMTEKILKRLKYSNKIISDVKCLVYTHMRPLSAGAPGIRRLMRDVEDLYPTWRELKYADAMSCKINEQDMEQEFQDFDAKVTEVLAGPSVSPLSSLEVNGKDLMHAGIPEGRIIGNILKALHEKVLDDPSLNSREALLKLALDIKEEL